MKRTAAASRWSCCIQWRSTRSPAFFVAYHGEVSPDGPGYFPVIAEKLYRMHSEEPTLTDADEDARYLVGKTTVTHYQVVDQIEDSSGPSEEP